ncbi:hypothetical protein LOK49_LG06G01049 [Camellia lanceoleosa]|uniref:Uncharacterized protein n=1 Tax=Camellia lanceoleosa TaxID=1840588 RepID=A0ACC0HD94_9ERIC|nr:hypothetical protein LOK49_LG06G01049 [Camellia lanceoleosa]
MEATREHAKNLESNEKSWINSELNAKLKEKMTETRKQWKVEGRPLKMIVGTGLPLMYSHGTMMRIVANCEGDHQNGLHYGGFDWWQQIQRRTDL